MANDGKLTAVIAEMIRSDVRVGRVLPRGLALGFTPQELDDRPIKAARLAWSRRGVHPSEIEDGIMFTAVGRALRGVSDRVLVSGPSMRSALVLKPGWLSSMVLWRWVGTAVVGELRGSDRARAMEWLQQMDRPARGGDVVAQRSLFD